MNRKIAIIIERPDIALGGAERSVFELAWALSGLDAHVDILAAKGHTRAKNIHILCRHCAGKRTPYSVFRRALKKHLSRNHYDIVHSVLPFDFADVYQPRSGTFAESILRNAASYRSDLIASYKRVTAFFNYRRTMLLRTEKRLCRNPNGPIVAALSGYVAGQFKEHYSLDENRLVITRNGVRITERIDQAAADRLRGQILANLAINEADNPLLLLFVANNFRLKGLEVLLEAMSLVAADRTQRRVCLVVAGRGRSCRYRRLARKLNVHDRVVFLGKLRHVQNALSITDVAVLPTFNDPSSRFVLEALVARKPVITTKFNGAADMFVHDRHGKVIDTPTNTTALAQAICYFSDPCNIQKASQAIVEDNLKETISIKRVARELMSLYQSILEKKTSK